MKVMNYFVLLFLLVSPVIAQQQEEQPRSEYQQCLTEVRLRGGDAWAASRIELPSEDCCPAKFDERDIFRWCE